jgi:hypothetical protein
MNTPILIDLTDGKPITPEMVAAVQADRRQHERRDAERSTPDRRSDTSRRSDELGLATMSRAELERRVA